jgi:translation initiation factor IF-3
LNKLQQQFRVNGRIRAREVRVIMGSSGEQLGILKLSDALRKAQSLGLDLVEVAPTANPPVCKIVSLGKFRYDISKHERDRRPAGARLKELKFRVNIDEHDYLTKVRHGEEFLDRGNKVRVQLQFRGREMAHQDLGLHLMEKLREDLSGMSQVETEPKITGRNLTMTLAPLPANRRKRKFTVLPKTPEGEEAGLPSHSSS